MTLDAPTLERIRTDLDIDELLRDAVPPPACEFVVNDDADRCGERAAGVSVPSPCRHGVYLCTEHADEIRVMFAQPRTRWACPRCMRQIRSLEWRPL